MITCVFHVRMQRETEKERTGEEDEKGCDVVKMVVVVCWSAVEGGDVVVVVWCVRR